MDVGLLEGITGRFFSGESVPPRGGRVQSIKEHLATLLNTRRGSLPHLPDYGLPDSSQVSMKDRVAISKFGKEIEDTVKKYEPRLIHVRVKPTEEEPESTSDFRLGFLLEARVINESTRFHAFFSASGSADVEDAR
ncbi:type VI secretion system baseplate subunit TssE [Candidatus Poribacteria bacterium]